jgi:hypothetical protein
MGQRARVDRVGLDPRRGDRLGAQWVREVQLVAGVLEQFGQPLPAVGRLDGDPRLARKATEQLKEDIRVVGDPPREGEFAVLVDHRDMRTASMQVDANRIHWWASFDPGLPWRVTKVPV